jgi:hypothetical protein
VFVSSEVNITQEHYCQVVMTSVEPRGDSAYHHNRVDLYEYTHHSHAIHVRSPPASPNRERERERERVPCGMRDETISSRVGGGTKYIYTMHVDRQTSLSTHDTLTTYRTGVCGP